MREPTPGHVQSVVLLAFLSLFALTNVLVGQQQFGPNQGPSEDATETLPATSIPHG